MTRLLSVAILLAGMSYTGLDAQPESLPICKGGPFQGPTQPDRPPTVDDPRNCRAIPTAIRDSVGRGLAPVRKPGDQAALSMRTPFMRQFSRQRVAAETMGILPIRTAVSSGRSRTTRHDDYHLNGCQTNNLSYTGLYGVLQVRDPDQSQSGGHVINNYAWTPDGFWYYQAGWIDEQYGITLPRVFAESNISSFSRRYFDQYQLSDGAQYYFAVVSKPGSVYGLVWWNGTWNQLDAAPNTLPREGQMQQFLEILSFNGVHPNVATVSNYDSQLVYQDTNVYWDLNIPTGCFSHLPYTLNLVTPYHNWQAGS